MDSPGGYKLVELRNGVRSVHSLGHGETMHPGMGPVAEAERLYVQQLRLAERFGAEAGEFVIWDVGLGAAANALTVLRALRDTAGTIRLMSFENTLEPLRFAFEHRVALGYFEGFESAVTELIERGAVEFQNGCHRVHWELRVTDFPALLKQPAAQTLPKPHVILFDPWSPAKNPAMWTASLFADLFRLLDPLRTCAMPTYSRSTMLRVAWLLAGFHVGVGQASGYKEETTIAANTPGLITAPLDERWLERARRSQSAEPLWEPVYRQAPLTEESWRRLREHPQFAAR